MSIYSLEALDLMKTAQVKIIRRIYTNSSGKTMWECASYYWMISLKPKKSNEFKLILHHTTSLHIGGLLVKCKVSVPKNKVHNHSE